MGFPDTVARPVQAIHLAILYRVFGLTPLGYHLVNTLTFCLGVCVFYLALRELTGRRVTSLSTITLFGLLPHYSTDRFWYATFNGNISMVFLFFKPLLQCEGGDDRETIGLEMENNDSSKPGLQLPRVRSFHAAFPAESDRV